MTGLTGQVALVTGASRGIGRAVTQGLLQRGATVIAVYQGNDEAAAGLVREAGAGQRLRLRRLDVSDYQAVRLLFEDLENDPGRLDILVAAAGIRRDALLAMMDEDAWRRVLDVNLTGTFTVARFAVPLMLQHKYGRIICITSPMGRMGFAGQANYAASKAGQVAMMRSLAKEVAKKKITVNCVSPGFIETDFLQGLSPEQLESYRKMVPARRFGTAEEVAEAVLFLAGSGAGYITGSVLEITGGL